MTKEIDGVNVSECGFINACGEKWKCIILQDDVYETNPYCEGYDCYFKQLKRFEQENGKLKEQIKFLTEYRRKAVTCQECYDEGVEIGEMKAQQKLEKVKEKLVHTLVSEIYPKQLTNLVSELLDIIGGN